MDMPYTLYVQSNGTGKCVARITGASQRAVEAMADAEYGSNDYSWTYSPAFGFADGMVPGEVRDIEA